MARKAVQIIILLLAMSSQPVQALDTPILSEKEVKTEVTFKQLDRDELEREFKKITDKCNELEKMLNSQQKEIKDLQDEVNYLKSK